MACVSLLFASLSFAWNIRALQPKVVAMRFLDLLSTGIPVGLPTALSTANSVAIWRLHKHKIECLNPSTLTATGQANLVIFDKTRTITGEKMTIVAVLPTVVNRYMVSQRKRRNVRFEDEGSDSCDNVAVFLDGIDSKLLFFSNDESRHSESDAGKHQQLLSPLRRSSFLAKGPKPSVLGSPVESPFDSPEMAVAMSVCNSLIFVNGELRGDDMDMQLMQWAGFRLTAATDKDFMVRGHGQGYLILQRFPFSTQTLRTTVVVFDFDTRDVYCFTKGAPERIIDICDPATVPSSVGNSLVHYGSKGQRVVGFAFRKLLPSMVPWSDLSQNGAEGIDQLSFLGLVVFDNPIKLHTDSLIHELKTSGVHSILCSGDNVYTSLAVGAQLGLLKPPSLQDYASESDFSPPVPSNEVLRCLVPELRSERVCWLEIEIDTRVAPDTRSEPPPLSELTQHVAIQAQTSISTTFLCPDASSVALSHMTTSTWNCGSSDEYEVSAE